MKYYNASFKDVSRHEMKMLLLRSFLSTISMYLLYGSLTYLPVGLWSIIFNCGPLLTLLLGMLILRENLNYFEVFNLVISFTGVVIVIFNS
jgi:drug/metabolite transporter (DMT)-like permease